MRINTNEKQPLLENDKHVHIMPSSLANKFLRLFHFAATDSILTGYISDHHPRFTWVNRFANGYGEIARYVWPAAVGALLTADLITLPNSQMVYTTSLGPYLPEEVGFWLLPSLVILAHAGMGALGVAYQINRSDSYCWGYPKWSRNIGVDEVDIEAALESNKIKKNIFYSLIAMLNFSAMGLSQMLLAYIIFNKTKIYYEYKLNKDKCEMQNKQYVYMPYYGNDECAVCPDWNFIAPFDAFSAQACLDGLMSTIKEPKEVLSYLEQLKNQTGIHRIIFSEQDYSRWSYQHVTAYFSTMAEISQQYDIVDISKIEPNTGNLDNDSLHYIFNDFCKMVGIDEINVNHLKLGDAFGEPLIVCAMNAKTKSLKASNNDFSDKGFGKLSDYQNATILQDFDVSFNNGTNAAIVNMGETHPRTLKRFNFAGNSIDGAGFTEYCYVTWHSNLTSVNASFTDLSNYNLTMAGAYLSNSLVEDVDLTYAKLNDDQVCDFTGSVVSGSIIKARFGHNKIQGSGAVCAIEKSRGSNIDEFDFSGNPIGNDELEDMGPALQNTTVSTIGLSRISASPNAMIKFIENLPQDRAYAINLSDNPYGVEFGKALAVLIEKYPKLFSSLNVSHMQLKDAGGKPIVIAVLKSDLMTLMINENLLTDIFDGKFPDRSKNLYFYCDRNKIKTPVLVELIKNAGKLKLHTGSFNDNPLDADTGVMIAPYLLNPRVKINNIGANVLPQWEAQQLREFKPIIPLRELSLFGSRQSTASQNAFEQVQGIMIGYDSTRGVNSSSNISSSIYLGFATAPFIAPVIVSLILASLLFRCIQKTCHYNSDFISRFSIGR